MWTLIAVVCSILLPLSYCSDIKYANVEGEGKQPVQVISFERFTRAMDKDNDTMDNVTVIQEDHHIYYTSVFHPPNSTEASNLWVELNGEDGVEVDEFDGNTPTESELSGLHRYYQAHDLKFEFPFYGHILNSLAVTTGGFLYTGDILHDQLHRTQFIAPLQADFNPTITDNAKVLVLSTDDRFTVQWNEVHNHDHQDNGTFTFQVSIFPSGIIHFVYKEVPLPLDEIDNSNHPVEVGLADAYYYIQQVSRDRYLITVTQYHTVSLKNNTELSYSAYVLTPLPNCVMATSSSSCAELNVTSDFECEWCKQIQRCSDGVDRHRQEWLSAGCHEDGDSTGTTPSTPIPIPTSIPTPIPTPIPPPATSSPASSGLSVAAKAGISAGVIVLLLLCLLIVIVLAVFYYGYRRPNSKLGQFMIKHRPKARTLNKSSNASYEVSPEKAVLDEDTQ